MVKPTRFNFANVKNKTLNFETPKNILPKTNNFFRIIFNKITKFIDEPHEKLTHSILLTLLYSIIYKLINEIQTDSFSEDLSYVDSLYLASISTFLGFGNIAPKSNLARFAVISQAIIFLIIILAA